MSNLLGNLKLAFFLSFKSMIKGNRWALVMIIIVMSLSFANLVLTPSILSGVTETLNQQQIDTLYGNIVIDPQNTQYYINDVNNIRGTGTGISGCDRCCSSPEQQRIF